MESRQRPDALTARAVRRLLADYLRSSSDFDAFCIDMFPQIYAKFAAAMNRTERTSLLIVSVSDVSLIVERLNEHLGTIEHQHLPTLPLLTISRELINDCLPVLEGAQVPSAEDACSGSNDNTQPVVDEMVLDDALQFQPAHTGGERAEVDAESVQLAPNQAGRSISELPAGLIHGWRRWAFVLTVLAGSSLCALAAIHFGAVPTQTSPSTEDPVASIQSNTPPPPAEASAAPAPPSAQQEDQAVLIQAKREHLRDGELGLFLSLSTLDALREVISIFEARPSLEPALISRKLIDRLRRSSDNRASLQPLMQRLSRGEQRLPARDPVHRQLAAALTDDPTRLGKALTDPDRRTRLTAAQRLVWMHFSSSMLHESLKAVVQLGGPEGVLAYGLLRQAGLRSKAPPKLDEMIRRSSEKQRLLLIAALGQWPIEDAWPLLAERIEHDQSSRVRRQALDALEEARQNQTPGTGGAANAEIVSEMGRWTDNDPDQGVRLRKKLVRRHTLQLPPKLRGPLSAEAPSADRVEVRFTGERLVRFALDGQQYTIPLRISLRPGPYRLSYRSRSGEEHELMMIPRGPSYTKVIAVRRSDQKIPIVH